MTSFWRCNCAVCPLRSIITVLVHIYTCWHTDGIHDFPEIAILINMWDWRFLFRFSSKIPTNNLANTTPHRVDPQTPFNPRSPTLCPSLKLFMVISMPLWAFAIKTVEFGDFVSKIWLMHKSFQEISNHSYVTCRDLIVSENCYMAMSQTTEIKSSNAIQNDMRFLYISLYVENSDFWMA